VEREVALSNPEDSSSEGPVLEVRKDTEARDHRRVLEAYTALNTGDSLEVHVDHDPRGLWAELERELAGAFEWEQLSHAGPEVQVRVTKRASTALPRVVADTSELFDSMASHTAGSVWQLEPGARDLDANIIVLQPNGEIATHVGPELDVLILVLEGSGELETELDTIQLQQGAVLWLPKKAKRRFIAGPDGLKYFTVHQRKPTLNISSPPQR